MNDTEQMNEEKRRQAACRRLGSNNPSCVACGENDDRCLELHEPAGRAYDDFNVIICRNCHRKITNPARNAASPVDPPTMERVGLFLIGLADFLLLLVKKLKEFGSLLLDGAKVCPTPWGAVEEVTL